jgi:DNA-binding transcriptional MocR family regulator
LPRSWPLPASSQLKMPRAFLADETPLAAFAPEHTILVDSLSKRVAPGLGVGFIVPPLPLREKVSRALQSGSWSAPGFAVAAATQLMADGCIGEIQWSKRADASRRQALARSLLGEFHVRGDSRSYHLWLELPEPWRAERFVAAAGLRGIAILSSSAFTVGSGHTPNAVRLALAAPALPVLERAITALCELLKTADHRMPE